MAQALYRSYRSKSFDEVVGQEHITSTLQAAIKSGRISHAYLFTGPRGVGKTSVARILAREVNHLPYEGEDIHLDIIEIDAASNRRIDEIRDLRDKVHVSPTSAKYKVYIIDEVHMLTREAFNALLKTLEEPPAHVIFILATTEAHKLPETIVSRTQRFNFKSIDKENASAHLAAIAKQEKFQADKEALELIAQHGEGSFRDSISLLDQLSSTGQKISVELVQKHLGLPKDQTITELLAAISNHRADEVIRILADLHDEAADTVTISKALAERLRKDVIANQASPSDLALLKKLIEVPASSQPEEYLEIILLESAISAPNTSETTVPHSSAPSPSNNPKNPDKKQQPQSKEVEKEEPAIIEKTPKQAVQKITPSGNFDLSMWDDVVENVKHKAASLFTALRLANPVLEDGELKLYFEFALHQKKVDQATSKGVILSAIEEISGDSLQISCAVDKKIARDRRSDVKPDFYKPEESTENLKAISNIFGAAEVLES